MSHDESFPDYKVTANESENGLYVFVWIYTILCFLLVAPLVIWGRKHQAERESAAARAGFYNEYDQQAEFNEPQQEHHTQNVAMNLPRHPHHGESVFRDPRVQQPVYAPIAPSRGAPTPMGTVFRELDRVATAQYPDQDPDFVSQLSGSRHTRSQMSGSQTSRRSRRRQRPPDNPSTNDASQAGQSNTPSAATTSRLYHKPSTIPKTQIWDVHGRRWKQRRPIGRPDVIHRNIICETESMGGSSLTQSEMRSLHSRGSRANASRASASRQAGQRGMSDVASSIMTEEVVEGGMHAQQQRHRVIINYGRRRLFSRRSGSSQASSAAPSFLAGTVDDISPNDAADAGDPGRNHSFNENDNFEVSVCCGPAALWRPRTMSAIADGLIELAEPDMEMKRIVEIGLPLTFGALANTLCHLITIAFIANFISTDAMVAYVIVHLMLGLTNELVGAVADAESTLCSHALSMGNWLLAGQYAQMSVILVVVVNGPLLYMWARVMDNLVLWLTDERSIAREAEEYTNVILFYQVLQGISRTLTVLFHLTGNEKFETRFAIGERVVMLIAVTCVSSLSQDVSLRAVGGIELILGSAAFFAKLAYALFRGWLRVFLKGMRSCVITKVEIVCTLLSTTFPLFVGAFLEYGEWEILLFFVSYLGPAEVATWAVVAVFWRFLETATEGFGEAAAIRVAYHLGSGNPAMAKYSSHKALLVSAVQALLVTSLLLMSGKNIANILTPDPVLKAMLSALLTHLGLGNIVMNAALSMWTLLGAQGRYRLATLVILLCRWLVTIPMALVCIYGFRLDLKSVMSAVTTGFATAVLALSYVFFRSDWERLSRIMQELNMLVMEPGSDFDSDDDDDDDSDDDDDDESGEEEVAATEPVTATLVASRLSSDNMVRAMGNV